MINHIADSVKAASARTGISTFLVYARSISKTFSAYSTFRPATWRCSKIVRQAGAYGLLIDYPALTVRATRGRLARVNWHIFNDHCNTNITKNSVTFLTKHTRLRWNNIAKSERISSESRVATACRQMIYDLAKSVRSTSSRTRILTSIPQTSFI